MELAAVQSGPIRQKTLKTAIHCTGVGLHSGLRTHMTLRPAPAGHGIEFVRTDLGYGDTARIQAWWNNVTDTRLCTMLSNSAGAKIGTVEHLLAALFGSDIDNAVIEVDGPEVPVMDGSAAPFVFLIECAGTMEQEAPRRAIQVLRRVSVEDGERSISITPGVGFSINFEIDFAGTAVDRQSCFMPFASGVFKNEIARARTFGFLHEISQLRAAGLARGGSLENAIVVSGQRVLNEDGLRFDDEFVRHKVLDCAGDLYLAGCPVIGHVVAAKSGHDLNNRLLRSLFARRDAWRYVDMMPVHQSIAVRGRAHLHEVHRDDERMAAAGD
jgi:UDP-3-O-[3-hydroxymyristoyl] N-acetylglucosamine deacetylase